MVDYEIYLIKEYKSWKLYLHEAQYPYIGRCYAWAKNDGSKKLEDMSKAERDELFDIVIPEWTTAVKKLFHADWINAAILGNTTPHVHWHLVPRYHSGREFYGIKFLDSHPKSNYSPYEKRVLPEDTLSQIKQTIIKSL